MRTLTSPRRLIPQKLPILYICTPFYLYTRLVFYTPNKSLLLFRRIKKKTDHRDLLQKTRKNDNLPPSTNHGRHRTGCGISDDVSGMRFKKVYSNSLREDGNSIHWHPLSYNYIHYSLLYISHIFVTIHN